MENEAKKVKRGIALLLFTASMFGIVTSTGLMKDDILSTANTVFTYFPLQFGVTPASTWEAALWIGAWTTILQVVSAGIAFSKRFGMWYSPVRVIAFLALCASLPFDNWTDIVFRSGYLTGNLPVATITTFAIYTGGSELTQFLSLTIFFSTWRSAISDLIYAKETLSAGIRSIYPEIQRVRSTVRSAEYKARGLNDSSSVEKKDNKPSYNIPYNTPGTKPIHVGKPANNSTKHNEPVYRPIGSGSPSYRTR